MASLMVFTVSGCKDSMYESQIEEISQYNEGIKEAKSLFKNEDIAKENEEAVVNLITCNEATKDEYNLLNIEEPLEKDDDEDEQGYIFRSMHTLMPYTTVDTYKEYVDWSTEASDPDYLVKPTYKYANPYIVKRGYYSSVSSNFLTQFLVIQFQGSTDESLKARVYWKDNKIQGIVIE